MTKIRVASKTLRAIDKRLEETQGHGVRNHLGASIIGRPCARQIWYTFRWAKLGRHKARILRLFDRGNREEERFVTWLRQAGIHVEDKDLETGKQLRIEDHDGHFGGSLDGRIFDTPDLPGEKILAEFKTHNKNSFNDVKKKGVMNSKLEHYVQMNIYMHYHDLKYAMYFAINKEDDDLHVEIIEYDEACALFYVDRAKKIIDVNVPPDRVSESPGWFVCQWCDFKKVCWEGVPKAKNCRTCKNSKPIDSAKWICLSYNYVLGDREQRTGCTQHQEIPE